MKHLILKNMILLFKIIEKHLPLNSTTIWWFNMCAFGRDARRFGYS